MPNRPQPKPRETLTCPHCAAQLDAQLGISWNGPPGSAFKQTVMLCAYCGEPAIYEVVALTGTGYLRSPTPKELGDIHPVPGFQTVRRHLLEHPPHRR